MPFGFSLDLCYSCGDSLSNKSYCYLPNRRGDYKKLCHKRGCCTRKIHSSNLDPLILLSFQGKSEGDIYLGVELEVEVAKGIDRHKKSQEIVHSVPKFLMCKEDGTIMHGFEMCTAPASLDIHKEMWPLILSEKNREGLSTFDRSANCGMHVHVSRNPLSNLVIGKILTFVNSPQTRENIISIAGRVSSSFTSFERKKISDVQHPYNNKRYQAVNIENKTTIEFRIFRSTTSVDHVLANVEFVDAVVRWCMVESISNIESWKSFWSYVLEYDNRYDSLVEFMDGGCEA